MNPPTITLEHDNGHDLLHITEDPLPGRGLWVTVVNTTEATEIHLGERHEEALRVYLNLRHERRTQSR